MFLVAGFVGILLILLWFLCTHCENSSVYQAEEKTIYWPLILGIILIVFCVYCGCYGWTLQKEKTECTTSYDIISVSSDDNYQMNLSGTTAFSIGYISGSANKKAEYVVFENHNEKGYIRKEYSANRTFVKFDSNDTPHVTVAHIKSIKKAKFKLLEDDVKDEWNETTIVVPENTHQTKFNVE